MANIFSLPNRNRLYLIKGKEGTYIGMCPFHDPRETLGLQTLMVDYTTGLYQCPDCEEVGSVRELSKSFIVHTDSTPTLKEMEDKYYIKIDSRYNVEGELDAAKKAYLIMMPGLRTWIKNIFIDSKSEYSFSLTLRDLPCVEKMATQVMDDFASCLIFVNGGHNGVSGESARGGDLGEISANWICQGSEI